MARDPPSLLSSSELRDISLTPTAIRSAKITIIHPQLRDLILPLERGRVLYPRGMSIEEQRWLPAANAEENEYGEEGTTKRGITGSTRPLLNLNFVPNCLTASSSIFACGGQHGELYISDLPQPLSTGPLSAKYTTSAPKIKPFTISTTLSGRSINNSIIIPPTFPDRWSKVSEERKLGYIGRGSRKWEEIGRYGKVDLLGKTEKGHWITRKLSSTTNNLHNDEDELMEDQDESSSDEDDHDEEDNEEAETEIMSEMDDDENHDGDGEEVEYEVSPHSPISSSSVATYPNTVPFLHAPRIPHLPNPSTPIMNRGSSSSSRRTGSYSNPSRDRTARLSFSSSQEGEGRRYGHPPIQVVTSRNVGHISPAMGSASSSTSTRTARGIVPPHSRLREFNRTNGNRRKSVIDEPRILISNNDCTVKMFSLHAIQSPSHTVERDPMAAPFYEEGREPFVNPQLRPTRSRDSLSSRPLDRLGLGAPRSSTSRTGTAFEWISPTSYNHHGPINSSTPFTLAERETLSLQRELQRASEGLREESDSLRRSREDFERIIGMRIGLGREGDHKDQREERKLNKVGGTRFKVATNHSSLSPDLKTMVSVGDSTEVSIFEVIDGGREFRKIAIYDAATDAGFSTAWSKDGRKFAVASQDGQVTVWDHRSSQPLAIFHTSADAASSSSSDQQPSFINDISASHLSSSPTSSNSSGWNVVGPEGVTLRDPITGDQRSGTSTSGKEAARVVKFSPEGSGRDLMVFSEENTNIHVIDAQTFHTHVVLPVPHIPTGTADPDISLRPRQGIENGTWGIAGVGFDPTGDWLYSGTERTVVEWDLRRNGPPGGGGGVWELA
ncbi:uncharacterized protein IL334_004177 [Kwoniella shivajii]|uniref:DUF2415 domain-containing protein n=1 Tax=Kwoniella shivajii TaxID=564305 RepID=A0ABZ1CZL5_9TREE|nr:hypothetical protein IL334_004177 [Kwoniella shivajii]